MIFEALDALARDEEFATLASTSSDAPSLVIKYLERRGVEKIDAQIVGIAYIAGIRHTLRWSSRELQQIRRAI